MRFAAVHQFHSGSAVGDAITNQMFDLQRRLRALGYLSDIHCEHIPPELAERIRPVAELQPRAATLLLVHHSMGHTAFPVIAGLDLPKVTVFHSITPASFFDDPGLRRYIRLGFRQLHELAGQSLFGVADSNHNRHQMYDAGFRSVEVMPVRTDFHEMRALRDLRSGPSDDWLFVGRMVPNKRQLDLVRAHVVHRRSGGGGALHLVGDLSFTPYVEEIRREIERLGAQGHVVLHGKLSQDALLERFRAAGLFVCLSEHEGFGVPLLEAMAAGLPVLARDRAAVSETMGGAGALLLDGSPASVAAVARVVSDDHDFRARLVYQQDQRLARLEHFDVDRFLGHVVERASGVDHGTTLQVQGPFETSYSLAILNRELALRLDRVDGLDVSIHATEGPGDYTPRDEDLARHPDATELYRRGLGQAYPEIVIRQMWPPRVADSTAGMTFQYFGWEESLLPPAIAEDFDRYLDGIGTMSSFVRDVLRSSGVTVPIEVVGVGVHQPDPAARCDASELDDLRTVRFLHISSAFPRKGVDVLLRGYFATFTGADDVTLVLKTFPNPHNDVGRLLAELRADHVDPPHVCWIDRDLDRVQIDGLYAVASAYVHTARGEGFGLPVAEAMRAGVPVISVASTGLADFVNPDTADVVGHRMEPAASHVSIPGSEWAEPSFDDLCNALRSLADGSDPASRERRVAAARQLIATEFTWERVAERWHRFIESRRRRRPGIRVAAVTTFNSRCGIAEYATHLYEPIEHQVDLEVYADDNAVALDPEREERVSRVWSNHRIGTVDRLLEAIDASRADVVHVQHNFGFFPLAQLARLVEHVVRTRPIVVTLHRTAPLDVDGRTERLEDVADALRAADALVVHQEADRRRLADAGVVDNVHLLLHGTEPLVVVDAARSRRRQHLPADAFVVGTFGFLLPHKGLIPLVGAVAELRARGLDARLVATCALHPDPSSAAHRDALLAAIERAGVGDAVLLTTDFLDPDDARDRLGAADVVVMPYEQTNESASGALRSVLPLGRAMVTTDLPIFADVAGVVPMIPSPADPVRLADELERLAADPAARALVATGVRRIAEETSWQRTASWTQALYLDLINARAAGSRAAGV